MSQIEWTDETWNPIIGCSKISDGCANCYAEKMANRLARIPATGDSYSQVVEQKTMMCGNLTWNGQTEYVESALEKPLHWRKPRMIFVCSMGDLFHESVPFGWVDRVFAVMALCPQHTFQVLTKRPERMREYFDVYLKEKKRGFWHGVGGYLMGTIEKVIPEKTIDDRWANLREFHYPDVEFNKNSLGDSTIVCKWPLPNVWLGVTAENQEMADERIPILLDIPAAKRFVSCEPLLGKINNLRQYTLFCEGFTQVDWVIVGAESGSGRRECEPEWIDSIVRQCEISKTPCFVKQIFENGKKVKIPKQYPQEFPHAMKTEGSGLETQS